MHSILKVVKNPLLLVAAVWVKLSRIIKSDKLYLGVLYFCRVLRPLSFTNPKTFTAKLQWMKVNYNKTPLHTQLVDKYGVRDYISKTIGEQYLFPLLGVWDNADDIDLNALPDKFVLKTTHDSGGVWICQDKKIFSQNWGGVKLLINNRLQTNYYPVGREYPYKNVHPRVIAEKFMVDESGNDLRDYKFFCFDGEPQILFYASERFMGGVTRFDFYDINRKRLPFSAKGHPYSGKSLDGVKNYDEMVEIARKLSKGFPHVRIDLYNINGRIYFGEFTFHHDGGFVPFIPREWDRKVGDMLRLPSL